jgi:hypothetical protein
MAQFMGNNNRDFPFIQTVVDDDCFAAYGPCQISPYFGRERGIYNGYP